jgi:hypothetical protein
MFIRVMFLGTFAKLQRVTVSFIMSFCVSARPSVQNNSAPTGHILMRVDIWEFFWKSVEKFQFSLKSDKNRGYCTWGPPMGHTACTEPQCLYEGALYFYMKTDIHFWSHFAHFLIKWKMFQVKIVEKIKTHILCSVTFHQKLYCLWDNVEKYCRVERATDDNMAHAHCMLDNQGYKYSHAGCVIVIAFPL